MHTLSASLGAITDDGLKHFVNCRDLRALRLKDAKAVTDAGLALFQNCPDLVEVDASGTKVTEAGARAFNKARPNCTVTWNGGTFGPKR